MSSSNSPCTTKCELDNKDEYCVKCGRTTQQIQDWNITPIQQRKEIIKEAKQRRKKNELG